MLGSAKRLKSVKVLLPLILLFVFACHKESASHSGWTFSASIGSKPWVPSQIFSNIIGGYIMVSGSDSTGKALNIILKGTDVGQYPLGKNAASSASYTDSPAGSAVFSTDQSSDTSLAGGNVNITAIDQTNKTISGTFYFNLYNDSAGNKKTITRGILKNLPFEY